MEAALEKTLDPIAGSPARGKSVAGIINLFLPDLEKTFKLVHKIEMM